MQLSSSYHISNLIYKSVSETISTSEQKELNIWLSQGENQAFYNQILSKKEILNTKEIYKAAKKQEVFDRIKKKIDEQNKPKVTRLRFSSVLKYAAVIVVLISTSIFIYNTNFNQEAITQEAIENINPGYEKATLVLADGTTIDLESKSDTIIASDKSTSIKNTSKGLVYNAINEGYIEETPKYNTLFVPSGGIYQIQLPDGTKVWLNSASSLKYPEKFTGDARIVELDGEAYFEVTKDKKQFIVQTNKCSVAVLGTHFNVSSYKDDGFFASTLVEGKIKLATALNKTTTVLSPNERATYHVNNPNFEVKSVDTAIYTAWKDGKFYFERERLDQILTKMARWYDVEITFENPELKTETFTGVAYKNQPIDYLLDMISKTTNVKYKITKNNQTNHYEVSLENS